MRPGLGKTAHIFQVPGRETLHLRELVAEVAGEPVDHLRPPSFPLLGVEDRLANLPVELDQFAVDRECGFDLGGADPGFEIGEERGVIGKFHSTIGEFGHDVFISSFPPCGRWGRYL